jgi:hypothetical protein
VPDAVLLAFPRPRGVLEVPRRYRASWISSSIQTLRRHGHYTRYRTLLDDHAREALTELPASAWISSELVVAHYDACDRLQLDASALATLGVETTRLAIGNTLHLALRLATGAGLVSPWTLLAQAQRLMSMICEGSGVEVTRLGPKEARVDVAAFPLARFAYNRAAMRGILLAGLEPFCQRVYASVVSVDPHASDVTFRASWV